MNSNSQRSIDGPTQWRESTASDGETGWKIKDGNKNCAFGSSGGLCSGVVVWRYFGASLGGRRS